MLVAYIYQKNYPVKKIVPGKCFTDHFSIALQRE